MKEEYNSNRKSIRRMEPKAQLVTRSRKGRTSVPRLLSNLTDVMLPPLLFESSFKINPHLFFAKIYLIVSLTVVAYYVTLFIASAIMLPLLTQTQQLKVSAVFLFISIIVATDPVAVVAILEQYGAPHRLRILIEGESLLNDGLALFTYRILQSALEVELGISNKFDVPQLIFVVVMSVVGSPLIGAIGARVVAWIIAKLQENKKRQAFILVSVYGMFMLCETCNASPALGLVVFGIMLSSYR
ncbi:hypothetical protein TELCIR_02754 [Teladorsagia circumcincta]|uniref:Cation/H+ exchanger transmembrane domain-containing protein n=1 Tax=Teladorsagia circumcincta TaxID=45464 RepID=A0A2G9UYD2_TELCI|nr:hypothetical protein TELCIR_02754 [Teladorsagia circumcincta]